ncbi:prepilin-type N-terminal cleavage/methylation domain-containing protein [Actinoplanes sp. NPDC049118]|uniref:PilW family protein n=1 Tax=Actinoplanes sp. NPDC049118 TaxID=3155769 RepID=UPI0033F55A2A
MRRIADEAAPQRDDAGLSLIELMVTMGVMSIVMLVFTTGIVQVYWANRRTETVSVAQSQLHMAFQRFDRELRYASSISLPNDVAIGTRYYVEFAEADPTKCVRLRLDTHGQAGAGILQLIRWNLGTPPTATSPWTTVASNLDVGSDKPFARQDVGEKPYATATVGQDFMTAFQRLRIRLTTKVADAVTTVDTTFTAVNSAKAITNGCMSDWARA